MILEDEQVYIAFHGIRDFLNYAVSKFKDFYERIATRAGVSTDIPNCASTTLASPRIYGYCTFHHGHVAIMYVPVFAKNKKSEWASSRPAPLYRQADGCPVRDSEAH